MRRAIDRLPDVDHGAADRDHDVPRQPPSAVSDTDVVAVSSSCLAIALVLAGAG